MKKLIFLISIIILFSACSQSKTISVRDDEVSIPGIIESKKESEFVHTLYNLRNTNLSSTDDVNTIFKTMPYFTEERYEITAGDSKLNITYNTELRSKYQNKKELENNLIKTAVTAFSLILDVQKIEIAVNDVYGEFARYIYDRDSINSCYGAEYFTKENIAVSTKKGDTYESFLIKVLDIECEKTAYDTYFEEISKKITDEYIIDYESAETFDLIYTDNLEINGFNIKELAAKNKLDIKKHIGYKLNFLVCDLFDFTKNKTESYLYVFRSDAIILYSKIENKQEVIKSLKNAV